MPRGSKKSANPHNNRHENGVVAPGKRIAKQKSNGHLNGGSLDAAADNNNNNNNNRSTSAAATVAVSSPGAVPKAVSTATGASSPSIARVTGSSTGRQNSAAARPYASNAARPNGIPLSATSASGTRKDSRTYKEDVVGDDRAGTPEAMDGADGVAGDAFPRQSSSNVARAFAGSSLPLPLTVLLSCPLRDTLAMLILLLSIPPVLVTATNSIFAVMTFVPPSGSFTILPTLSDITSSFSPTTPSFLVTCLIDVIAMSLWIWIPFPALQVFFLDAAQAMVATTLGGGSSQRPGAKDNTLACVSVVVATHIARYRSLFLKPIQHRLGRVALLVGDFDGSYVQNYPVEPDRTWWSTFKVFLALHIFCQGMTGMVRRRLHAPRQNASSASAKSSEGDSSHVVTSGVEMARHHSSSLSPTDLRPRPSLQNIREANRDKISSGKRRRKQANFVRAHQPFWAAVAATKTTVMREYETNRANADAVSAHATNADNLGNAPFLANENNVWITEIKDTGFFFETGILVSTQPLTNGVDEATKDEGVDRTKPMYVRCNKTDWVSMRMIPIPDSGEDHRQRWVGEVYGLSAGKTYQITFVKSDDDEVVLAQTVSTPAASANPISPSPAGAAFSPIRPSSPASPTATLKSSIASHEARLAELEDQARRTRKENKAAISSLNRELDGLNDRLQSHSSNDDHLHARLNHLVQHKKQLDDATDAIGAELDGMEVMPPDELKGYETRRASLDAARHRQTAAHNDLSELRKANKTVLDGRREQELSLQHKAERLQGRMRSLNARFAKLTEPEPSESDAIAGSGQRSNSDSSSRVVDRAALCAKYEEDIAALSSEFQLKTMRLNHLNAQVHALVQSMAQAEQQQQVAAQQLALQQQQQAQQHALNHTQPSLRLLPDGEYSRPTTPELLPSGAGIGTGFGRSASTGGGGGSGGIDSATFPTSSAWFSPDSATFNLNGTGSSSSRFLAQRTRRRSASGLSQDSGGGSGSCGGGPVFHPDDDDLVPPKIKRRSGYGVGATPLAFAGAATLPNSIHALSPAPRSGSADGSLQGRDASEGSAEGDADASGSGSGSGLASCEESADASAEGSAEGSSALGTGSGKGSPSLGS